MRKIALLFLALGAVLLIYGLADTYIISSLPYSYHIGMTLYKEEPPQLRFTKIGLSSILFSLGFFGFFYWAYRKRI